jgi:excinuclease ABC subunit A
LDKGFREVLVNGRRHRLRERIDLSRYKKHDIDVLIDELDAGDEVGLKERLPEAVEQALNESEGLVRVVLDGQANKGNEGFILSARFACPYDGFSYPEVEPRLFSFNSPQGACPACHGLGTKFLFGSEACPVCLGARLRPEALNVLLGGPDASVGASKSIAALTALSISAAKQFFDDYKWTVREKTIADPVTKEITARLQFLLDVGLEYLTLDRRAHTLSGGESQRIRLASQLGSRLVGTLYVLDEPTIGLHPRDNDRLLKTLAELRDLGNTIIVVEHDHDTIFASDYLVDIGPGAGRHGGEVVVAGPTDKLLTGPRTAQSKKSLTVDYLRGEREVPVPAKRRQSEKGTIRIRGAKIHNLDGVNVDLPLGRLVAVTGVSGSGKSTLVHEVLYRNLQARLDRKERSAQLFNCREFSGTETLNRVVLLDQAAIGRTPRSNPATYTGAFGPIRDLFAASEGARVKGWGPGRFSFNRPGGRCEACQGNGAVAVEMHFLPTVYVECEVCHGKRFQKETLSVKYQGKNIYEVLKMTVEEALPFFASIPQINDRLAMLQSVGLGYLELGQPATTLSGGEAQRIKIAAELFRPETHRAIYVLDEPTVGLHYEDVRRLVEILQELVNRGNSVITIEHNLDVIKSADYVIDLGPEGGAGGGQIVAQGTPEEVSKMSGSLTAKYLKRALK